MTYLFIILLCVLDSLFYKYSIEKILNIQNKKKHFIFCVLNSVANIILSTVLFKFYVVNRSNVVQLLFIILFPILFSFAFTSLYIFTVQIIKKDLRPRFFLKHKKKEYLSVSSIAILFIFIIVFSFSLKIADVSIIKYSDWADESYNRQLMSITKSYPTKAAVEIGYREGILDEESVKNNFGDIVDLDYPLSMLSVNRGNTGKSADQDKCNIVVLGDSFVWGDKMNNLNNLFWNQLSMELEKRGYNCNVYGVGIGAANTLDELNWLRNSTLVEDLQPDIIIIGYVTNDPLIPDVTVEDNNNNSINAEHLISIFSKIYPNIGYILDNRSLNGAGSVSYCKNMVSDENIASYEKYVISPMAKWIEENKIPVNFVTLPTRTTKDYYNVCYEPVEALLEKYNIPFYNCLNTFCDEFASRKHKNNYTVTPDDAHPGTASSFFFSQYIADFLEKDYPDFLKKLPEDYNPEYKIKIDDWCPYNVEVKNTVNTTTSCEATFTYPAEDGNNLFLNLPIKENYIMLSFEHPVDIREITIDSDNVSSAVIYYQHMNPKLGYDDTSVDKIGAISDGKGTLYDDKNVCVTSLCIHADVINSQAAKFKITVRCDEGGVVLW